MKDLDFNKFYNDIVVTDASIAPYEIGDVVTNRIVTSYDWVEAEAVYKYRLCEDKNIWYQDYIEEYSVIEYDGKVRVNDEQVSADKLVRAIYRLLTEGHPGKEPGDEWILQS